MANIAQPSPYPLFRAENASGQPLVMGQLFTYEAGTNIPQVSYTDSTEATPQTNPVILNARGEAPVWLDPTLTYKLVLEDQFGNLIWTVDNVPGGYIPGTGLGAQLIGQALYPQTLYEQRAGITPVNYQYPPGYVDRYGTNSAPGSTDMTQAVQNAVNALNNWDVFANVSPNKGVQGPDTMQGGIVQFGPAVYAISNTIRLAPNVYLKGTVGGRATNPQAPAVGGASGAPYSVIQALPAFPTDQFMVDTATWRTTQENGQPVVAPYRVVKYNDQMLVGSNIDSNPIVTNCGILDITLDGVGIAFGGYRAQNIFYARSNNFQIYRVAYSGITFLSGFEHTLGWGYIDAPIGLYLETHESFMQDSGELTIYSQASTSWTSANQTIINNGFYQSSFASRVGTQWGGLTLKEVMISCVQATFGFFGGNVGNVGFDVNTGRVGIDHWENEYTGQSGQGGGSANALFLLTNQSRVTCYHLSTKCQCPLSTGDSDSQLIIMNPKFIQPSAGNLSFTPFNGETSSTFEVQIHNPIMQDADLGATNFDFSVINQSRVYDSVLAANGATPVFYNLQASTSGNANSAGLGGVPGTVDGCLAFIANNPQNKYWNISLAGGQTHTITQAHSITGATIRFSRNGGASAPLLGMTVSPILTNCEIQLGQVNLTGWTTAAAFLVDGTFLMKFPIGNAIAPGINIPAGLALVGCAQGFNHTVEVTILGNDSQVSFGAGSAIVNMVDSSGGGSNRMIYKDNWTVGEATLTGTPLLEATPSGFVNVLHSSMAPQVSQGVATGTSSPFVVNHGLAGTPQVVLVTAGILGETTAYVNTITSTQFTIQFSPSSTATFYWQARLQYA